MKDMYQSNRRIQRSLEQVQRQNERLRRVIKVFQSSCKTKLVATGKKIYKRRKRATRRREAKRLRNEQALASPIKRSVRCYYETRKRKYLSGDTQRKEYIQRNLARLRRSVNRFSSHELGGFTEPHKESEMQERQSQTSALSNRFSADLDLLEQKRRGSASSYQMLRDRMKVQKKLKIFPIGDPDKEDN